MEHRNLPLEQHIAMIPVSLTTLLMLSMVVGVGLLSLSWVVAIMIERRNDRKSRRDLIQCRICGTIYENPERKDIASCPGCGSFNEATQPSPI